MTELLGLPYSPWTEKARWALDARAVPYTSKNYSPMIGEPLLRLKTGNWSKRVTVPVLTQDDGKTLTDSLDIARWADARGEGPTLFPKGRDADIDRYVALSEKGLAAGRALSLARVQKDDAALGEMVPKSLRAPLGPLATKIAAFGVRRTLSKYGSNQTTLADHEASFALVLDELRADLERAPAASNGKPKTLLGQFSFADVVMTQVLTFVDPPSFGVRIGEASRRSFTDDALRERYADLVAWRDAIYEAHRPRVAKG